MPTPNVKGNACTVVPDGLLLAFHSYAQMDFVLASWQASGIMATIEARKQVFPEPRSAKDLPNVRRVCHASRPELAQHGNKFSRVFSSRHCRHWAS